MVELEILAVYLGIKIEVFKKIQAECLSDVDRTKLGLFTYWLENDSDAS